jgi:hypothetical protein
MKADNFRHLFRVMEMALDSIFNHLTQIGKSVGFGCNSMTESGSDKASIDKILCDFKDNFHRVRYHNLFYTIRAGFIECRRPESVDARRCSLVLPGIFFTAPATSSIGTSGSTRC